MTGSSLYKNRYHTPAATLESSQICSSVNTTEDKVPAKTCLPDDDPRVYLMRRQKSLTAYSEKTGTGRKLKRAKTMLLPLETIPKGIELQNLSQVILGGVGQVHKALLKLASHDDYVKNGKQATGLDTSTADMATFEKKLERIVKRWVQATGGEQFDIVLDLGGLQGRSIVGA
jgi:hypothetical protein